MFIKRDKLQLIVDSISYAVMGHIDETLKSVIQHIRIDNARIYKLLDDNLKEKKECSNCEENSKCEENFTRLRQYIDDGYDETDEDIEALYSCIDVIENAHDELLDIVNSKLDEFSAKSDYVNNQLNKIEQIINDIINANERNEATNIYLEHELAELKSKIDKFKACQDDARRKKSKNKAEK